MENEEKDSILRYRQGIYAELFKSTKTAIFKLLDKKRPTNWKNLRDAAQRELTARREMMDNVIVQKYFNPSMNDSGESLISFQLDASVLQAIMIGAEAMCQAKQKDVFGSAQARKQVYEEAWAVGVVAWRFGAVARELANHDEHRQKGGREIVEQDRGVLTEALSLFASTGLFALVDEKARPYLQRVSPRAFMRSVESQRGKVDPKYREPLLFIYKNMRTNPAPTTGAGSLRLH